MLEIKKEKAIIVLDNLGSGGAQRLFANLAKYLVSQGHQVDVFIYSDAGGFFEEELIESKVNIVRSRKPGKGFSFTVLLNLIRFLNKRKPDVVLGVMHAPSIYATLASVFAGCRAKLSICEMSSSTASVSKLRRGLFLACGILTNRVVTNSYAEAELMRRSILSSRNVKTIWNGYDLSKFSFSESVTNSSLRLLVVGRIAYPKNAVNVLLALEKFYERNGFAPDLIWAGREDSDPLSVDMQKEMKQIIENSSFLQKKVKFLGEVGDIQVLYHTSTALLHMSLYEGLPNVVCEAMLLGCPVLASNVCDHPRVLGGHGERGMLANPVDPLSICACIESYINLDPEQKKAMVESARQYAEENFDIKKMASAYLDFNRQGAVH